MKKRTVVEQKVPSIIASISQRAQHKGITFLSGNTILFCAILNYLIPVWAAAVMQVAEFVAEKKYTTALVAVVAAVEQMIVAE